MVFLWYYYWISTEFLWDFHDVSMIFLEDFYGISEGMLWEFYGILMGFPLDSYWIFMVFLWCFYDISMGFLLDSCGISIGFLWDFQGTSMMSLWYFYGIIIGILMGFLCGSYAIPLLKFFPLLKRFSFTFLIKFLSFEILRNAQFPKIYDGLLKPNFKTSLKQFFKGVVHEQPWSTIVCLFGGFTIVSSCFLGWFFQTIPLPFPLLKFFCLLPKL